MTTNQIGGAAASSSALYFNEKEINDDENDEDDDEGDEEDDKGLRRQRNKNLKKEANSRDSLSVSNNNNNKNNQTLWSKKKLAAEERERKRHQEAVLREIEQSLIQQFETSSDPFVLNLIMIENSRDYGVNKYNTLSCLIAKSFEKWTNIGRDIRKVFFEHINTLKKNFKKFIILFFFCSLFSLQLNKTINDEMKIDAFVVASKFNIMVVEYVIQPYKLDVNNQVLLPFLKHRLKTLDYKDRAVVISELMMQNHFNCEEVKIKLKMY